MIKTYTEPFNHPRPYVNKSDLAEALKVFGPDVRAIIVNPSRLADIESAMPEDIELKTCHGCAAWEIWGEFYDKSDVAKLADGQLVLNNFETLIASNVVPEKRGRGRPRKEKPTSCSIKQNRRHRTKVRS